MPGDRWQQLATLRAPVRLHVGPSRQAAAVHGPGVRAGRRVGRAAVAGLVAARRPRPPRRARLVGDLNRVYRETPALWSRDIDPAGFAWIDANDASGNVFSFLRYGDRRLGAGLHRQLLRRSRTRATGSGLPTPGGGARWSTPTPSPTSVPGVGNFGGVEAVDGAVARPAGLGHAPGPAAGRAVAAFRPRRRLASGSRRPGSRTGQGRRLRDRTIQLSLQLLWRTPCQPSPPTP